MKKLIWAIAGTYILLVIVSCRGAENKVDKTDTGSEQVIKPGASDTPIAEPVKSDESTGTARGMEKTGEPGKILANIDSYVVCKLNHPEPVNDGGFTNVTLTVENTLTDATIQRALVEVSILLADGKEFRTDYYTVINIEPGGNKTVKIPNSTRGSKITAHIVKLKSMELTKGEMILVGNRYVPQ